MDFEKGSRNSVLKAANTICSNKQTGVQEQLSGDIQSYFPLKHQLLTVEKSMALRAARIKVMGMLQTSPNSLPHLLHLSPTASALPAPASLLSSSPLQAGLIFISDKARD